MSAERWTPPALEPDPPRVEYCTPAQLDVAAKWYADEMAERGFTIGTLERETIRRAAAIQDVWRVAFAQALGSTDNGGGEHER